MGIGVIMNVRSIIFVAVVAVITYIIVDKYTEDVFQEDNLDGKNVIITGASAGIGKDMAFQYAKYGANVFITARRGYLLKEVIEKCKSLGRQNRQYGYIEADLGKVEDRKKFMQHAVEFLGDIDQMILNHAIQSRIEKWTGSEQQLDDLENILNINMISHVHLAALALSSLRKTSGSIGVVGSLAGRIPVPYILEYAASKFALDGFFSGLRYEFKATKETVSITHCILGIIDTDVANGSLNKSKSLMGSENTFLTELFPPAHSEDAARAIISATTLRKGELYFPHYQLVWLSSVLRSLNPEMEKSDLVGYQQV